jgi:hypothetical protein
MSVFSLLVVRFGRPESRPEDAVGSGIGFGGQGGRIAERHRIDTGSNFRSSPRHLSFHRGQLLSLLVKNHQQQSPKVAFRSEVRRCRPPLREIK